MFKRKFNLNWKLLLKYNNMISILQLNKYMYQKIYGSFKNLCDKF